MVSNIQTYRRIYWSTVPNDGCMASPYEVLGVDPDADAEAVERRYRELVKEVHPDAGGSAEEFKRVRDAYRTIVEGDGDAGVASDTGGESASTGHGRGTDRAGGRGGAGADGRRSGRHSGGESSTAGGRGRTQDGAYTGRGRRSKASSGERRRRDGRAASATGTGTTPGATRKDRGRRDAGSGGSGSSVGRRAFLYSIPPLLGLGAFAHYEGAFDDLLGQEAAEGSPARADTVSREVSPDELFPVEFQASAGSTVRFTVDGADTSDWVKVYTLAEYEEVESRWEDTGEFDQGDPLRTVLTEDGYVAELPDDGTYVVLVKLWEGPPEDPRDPRRVEVSYEVSS